MITSFYTEDELKHLGLKKYGINVLISRKSSLYSPHLISLGDHVRIDDFTILSGNIIIGSYVHISAYVALYGSEGIFISDYSGVSSRTTIYSAVDDFSGDFLIGPMYPSDKTHINGGSVYLKKYTQIGASCVIMPNIVIEEGVVVGAMSFVNKTMSAWTINAGIPCKKIKDRSQNLLKLMNNVE